MILNIIRNTIHRNIPENTFSLVLELIKNKIIEQAKIELNGTEKKHNVDSAVIEFIRTTIICKNPIVNTLINILTDYIPVLTQYIYEYLKKYVDGLTEV